MSILLQAFSRLLWNATKQSQGFVSFRAIPGTVLTSVLFSITTNTPVRYAQFEKWPALSEKTLAEDDLAVLYVF